MRKQHFWIIPIVIIFVCWFCTARKKSTTAIEEPSKKVDTIIAQKALPVAQQPYIVQEDSFTTLSIKLVGDLMCHKPQSQNALTPNGTYDFNPSFYYVKNFLSNADLTIGNLETTFGGPHLPYSGYPAFNSPDSYADALYNSGFDFIVTANNHSMDTREAGILRTVDVLRKAKLGNSGSYLSQKDRDSIRILNINQIKIAILNYTYGTNGSYPESHHKYMLNIIDSSTITNDVKAAKSKGAEIVLVFYHFGIENIKEPTQAQKDAVKFAYQSGANLIIGAHPHVVGPSQFLPPLHKGGDSVFVAYSLGNFISNQYWRYTDAGVILGLTLKKNTKTKQIKIIGADYLPTWVYRGDNSKMKQHIVLPAELVYFPELLPDFIDSSAVKKMKEALSDTKQILTLYHNRLKLYSISTGH